MGAEFTFYDYYDADGSGNNAINGWLNGEGSGAKAHFNRMITYLEASPPAGFRDSLWSPNYVWHLHGEWRDFIELRRNINRIQYRLIGWIEGRSVFLVTWGYHRGPWQTDITARAARERVEQMKNNGNKYRREHDFS